MSHFHHLYSEVQKVNERFQKAQAAAQFSVERQSMLTVEYETESSRVPTLELIDIGADSVIEPNCDLMDEEYELMVEDQSESTVSDWESLSAPDELPEEGDMSDTEHPWSYPILFSRKKWRNLFNRLVKNLFWKVNII